MGAFTIGFFVHVLSEVIKFAILEDVKKDIMELIPQWIISIAYVRTNWSKLNTLFLPKF